MSRFFEIADVIRDATRETYAYCFVLRDGITLSTQSWICAGLRYLMMIS